MPNNNRWHTSVLLKETIDCLKITAHGRYVDATLGTGGHSLAILKKGGRALSLEADPQMIKLAKSRLRDWRDRWQVVQGNFADIEKICRQKKFFPVRGIIFDLGISSLHYEKSKKGFSFKKNENLDMRLDRKKQKITAGDILNQYRREELAAAFSAIAQEKLAGKIARAIEKERGKKKIKKTGQLAEIIRQTYKKEKERGKTDPATKVFMALRIMVNNEENNLKKGLEGGFKILSPGGRLAVISFHSGEDRIVKKFFKTKRKEGEMAILTRRPIYPSRQEKKANPLSRSARLRAARKK